MRGVFWSLYFAMALVYPASSSHPCMGRNYTRMKLLCVQALQQKIQSSEGSLLNNCQDFAEFAQCVSESARQSRCSYSFFQRDSVVEDLRKNFFSLCPKQSDQFAVNSVHCNVSHAAQMVLKCGTTFFGYVFTSENSSSLRDVTSVCPHVDDYLKCTSEGSQSAKCSPKSLELLHLNYVSNKIVGRYLALCRALRNTAHQVKTTACNQKRFINDIFLCGYHFSNIVDVLDSNGANVCPYYMKYQACHNVSIETYGCAPPDPLYADASAFFSYLTSSYSGTCPTSNNTARQVIARVVMGEEERTCDANKFIRHFLHCAATFINATDYPSMGKEHVCRLVNVYRHCVSGARHVTHCNRRMALNGHLAYMQNYVVQEFDTKCAKKRAGAQFSLQRMDPGKNCDADKAQKKYEFCAGDFMRMIQLVEIGFDNEKICQLRDKYHDCLMEASRENHCDYNELAVGRMRTLTALLKRDYSIDCNKIGSLGRGGVVQHGGMHGRARRTSETTTSA
ncbi:uncharacterized protein LOC135378159 isoform X2 [Ornithodoros turicata]|uniref:uncharacterized protein LOC135378159 isoform X2 n=1 Tax=Ornithodoros turicata TaxID=34597 RepID=UPI003138F15A